MDITFITIISSVVVFLIITLLLVGALLGVKAKLLPSGPVSLTINGEEKVEVSSGGTLLSTLGDNKIFLPSACGGGGTCIQCRCQIIEGGGELLPTEEPHFSRKEVSEGWRLGCQVKVKEDMVIKVPEEVFGIKKWEAKVLRNWNVASFIKEFVVEIPEEMDYKAGGYIQIEIPKCEIDYKKIDISAHPDEHPKDAQKFKLEWDKFNLWNLNMKNSETVERAYSIANRPHYEKILADIEAAEASDATLLLDGRNAGPDTGYYIGPTIFSEVSNDMDLAQHEIFGPVVGIIPFDDEEEVFYG